MRILFVEDDRDFTDGFLPELEGIPNTEIVVAHTLAEAIQQVDIGVFDSFIFDLRLPASDEDPEPDVSWGLKLLDHVLVSAPYTPVYFLTETLPDYDVIDRLLANSFQNDIWGTGSCSPTIRIFPKQNRGKLVDDLIAQEVNICALERIEINSGGIDLMLKPEQARILRVFTHRQGGDSCRVGKLDGGLSESRVLGLHVTSANGATRMHAVAKLDDLQKIQREVDNFTREVTRLPQGAYAPQVGVVRGAAKASGGVFYRLVSDQDRQLFEVLKDDVAAAARVVKKLQHLTASWREGHPNAEVRIGQLRERAVPNDRAAALMVKYDLDWIPAVERKTIATKAACIHGDLHGGNVFVGAGEAPVMIDFADVGTSACAIDPLTLELSIFTNPLMKDELTWEPDFSRAEWFDLDGYTEDCPYEAYIRSCREWSVQVAGGDLDILANAYSYLLRQFKYSDVDKEVVLALLDSIRKSIERTP